MPIDDIDKKTLANHIDAELAIYTMVLNRLPFLVEDDTNKLLISQFTLELMHELNPCMLKSEDEIGIELNYTVLQQGILADLVCCYLLLSTFAQNMNGGITDADGNTVGGNTFLEEAKAGSVEVKFGQLSVKDSAALISTGPALLNSFKRSAIKKAATLGCIIDVCDDCSVSVLLDSTIEKPFIVVTSNCGC